MAGIFAWGFLEMRLFGTLSEKGAGTTSSCPAVVRFLA